MDKGKIFNILDRWWDDEDICSGEEGKCVIKECDLCINCFEKLKDMIENVKDG